MAALELAVKELAKAPRTVSPKDRKAISEFKVIQNILPLTEDKLKFREWNTKFVNAMGQVDPLYKQAIKKMMHWADSEVSPDLEHGWPQRGRVMGIGDMDGLDVEMLVRDIINVRLEKGGRNGQHESNERGSEGGHPCVHGGLQIVYRDLGTRVG